MAWNICRDLYLHCRITCQALTHYVSKQSHLRLLYVSQSSLTKYSLNISVPYLEKSQISLGSSFQIFPKLIIISISIWIWSWFPPWIVFGIDTQIQIIRNHPHNYDFLYTFELCCNDVETIQRDTSSLRLRFGILLTSHNLIKLSSHSASEFDTDTPKSDNRRLVTSGAEQGNSKCEELLCWDEDPGWNIWLMVVL